jgi:putative flippase GtrA
MVAPTRRSMQGRLRQLLRDPTRRRRIWRYAITSVVATVVSESVLLVTYSAGALDAAVAAVVANLAGTLPSYLMSRYWIWPEADRRRAGRQVVLYWLVSLVSLVLSSAVTGASAAYAPAGHLAHLVVVAVSYVGTYGLLWMGKFAVYQLALFRPPPERRLEGPLEAVEPLAGGEARSIPR